MLESSFKLLLKNYTDQGSSIDAYWNEINSRYNERHRYYHTPSHLHHLLMELTAIKAQLKEWDALLFALYYHDIIYDPLRSDNEERSAILAKERMNHLLVADAVMELAVHCIRATRSHVISDVTDVNFFTDADLAVLGQAPEVYKSYCSNIRKEYKVYPDELYHPGRSKLLCGFLQRTRIFKTDYFYKKYEEQARINIAEEIAMIS